MDNQEMLRRIVECVPNFSEGRDPEVLHQIAAAIRAVPGVLLLGAEQDADHHRAVITYAGSPEAVVEAAVRSALVARERIDLRRHQGVHPRIGALDVLPFIPVQNVSLAECATLARQAAQQIWERCGIPCYLYEAAALREDRRNLADVRRGNFEGLAAEVAMDPTRHPDIGGPLLHPSAGAVAVGARKFLVAWNVLLKTSDVAVAREIAALIRQSSGGFPFVKALGLELPSRGITQVSMNLLDFEETPMQPVFDVIAEEALKRGVEVIGSELIGFLPRKALEVNVRQSLHFLNLAPDRVLEHRIDSLEQARFPVSPLLTEPDGGHAEAALGLQLLAQAAHMMAGLFAGQETADAMGQKPPHLYEAEAETQFWVREAQALLHRMGDASHTESPDAWDEPLLRLAEHCVALKSRLVAEKLRFVADPTSQCNLERYQTAWQLAEAALRLTQGH